MLSLFASVSLRLANKAMLVKHIAETNTSTVYYSIFSLINLINLVEFNYGSKLININRLS